MVGKKKVEPEIIQVYESDEEKPEIIFINEVDEEKIWVQLEGRSRSSKVLSKTVENISIITYGLFVDQIREIVAHLERNSHVTADLKASSWCYCYSNIYESQD